MLFNLLQAAGIDSATATVQNIARGMETAAPAVPVQQEMSFSLIEMAAIYSGKNGGLYIRQAGLTKIS